MRKAKKRVCKDCRAWSNVHMKVAYLAANQSMMLDALVHSLTRANEQYASLQRFVREHGEQCRKQRKIDSDFIHDVQMCMAQGQDTLCGSRWINVAGLRMAFQRKSDAEEKYDSRCGS